MLLKTSNTMKCDNSLSAFGDNSGSPSTTSPGLSQYQSGEEETLNNKDMQYIYNKKRRFHNQPNKIKCSSPSSVIGDDGVVNDEDHDFNDTEEGEKRRLNAQKSKLLLPPQLYKSFLANAIRAQKNNVVGKSVDFETDFRSISSGAVTNFNCGLHIFPRNLLFSCSVDRKSPPPLNGTQMGSIKRPPIESTTRSNSSNQEVHTSYEFLKLSLLIQMSFLYLSRKSRCPGRRQRGQVFN